MTQWKRWLQIRSPFSSQWMSCSLLYSKVYFLQSTYFSNLYNFLWSFFFELPISEMDLLIFWCISQYNLLAYIISLFRIGFLQNWSNILFDATIINNIKLKLIHLSNTRYIYITKNVGAMRWTCELTYLINNCN